MSTNKRLTVIFYYYFYYSLLHLSLFIIQNPQKLLLSTKNSYYCIFFNEKPCMMKQQPKQISCHKWQKTSTSQAYETVHIFLIIFLQVSSISVVQTIYSTSLGVYGKFQASSTAMLCLQSNKDSLSEWRWPVSWLWRWRIIDSVHYHYSVYFVFIHYVNHPFKTCDLQSD